MNAINASVRQLVRERSGAGGSLVLVIAEQHADTTIDGVERFRADALAAIRDQR